MVKIRLGSQFVFATAGDRHAPRPTTQPQPPHGSFSHGEEKSAPATTTRDINKITQHCPTQVSCVYKRRTKEPGLRRVGICAGSLITAGQSSPVVY
ncbi:GM19490 [Drosophila sechellia]|uniref:GM19490 n=1 Tax=Drosophila sechellia TaxID=7238 RepID=B4IA09_DROSE|nr:GM19490 [Drosophila sechellia]